MGLKLTTDTKEVTVFRKDRETHDGGTFATYSIGISSKKQDDTWLNGYLDVAFKKGVELSNKSKITISNAFPILSEYNGRTYIKWMITEFDIVEQGEAPRTDDGFASIPDGIDEDLPFAMPTR